MIEKVIRDYLLTALDVPVFLELPKTIPAKYVALEKTGSSRTNRIDRATLALQSVAPTMYEASELNELVKTAMDEAVALSDVVSSRLNSDYNFTDTTKKEYRYQAVYDVVHY